MLRTHTSSSSFHGVVLSPEAPWQKKRRQVVAAGVYICQTADTSAKLCGFGEFGMRHACFEAAVILCETALLKTLKCGAVLQQLELFLLFFTLQRGNTIFGAIRNDSCGCDSKLSILRKNSYFIVSLVGWYSRRYFQCIEIVTAQKGSKQNSESRYWVLWKRCTYYWVLCPC